MDNQFLSEIEKFLNTDAWNYTVFLRFYETSPTKDASKEAIVKTLLASQNVLCSLERVEKSSVWPVIESCLLYAGTDGEGPAASTIKSAKMAALMLDFEHRVRRLSDSADTIDAVDLQDGHPAYPVFWDFAFLFSGEETASLLIGSSSD